MEVSILDRIVQETRRETRRREDVEPLESLRRRALSAPPTRSFTDALRPTPEGGFRVIAEIKRASPSRGLIREPFDPPAIARAYVEGGCAAISVLTDQPFFRGCLADLTAVRGVADVPLLRKDFILEPYQVWESRAAGADAILLIVAALDDLTLKTLHGLAGELGLDVLVEVHDRDEMERAAGVSPAIVGVNNRNLRTFEVRLETSRELAGIRPGGALLVSESGFSRREELARMAGWGVDAFLIGESLMRAHDPGQALAGLLAAEAP